MMLTSQQIRQYRTDGYVLVEGLFTDVEPDHLETEFDGITERRLRDHAQLDATWDGNWQDRYPGTNYLDPTEYPIEQAVACPTKRGDVLFFHYLTIHGSGPNRSDRVRKTVLVQVHDPTDHPTKDIHCSHAQGMMLRGINPVADGRSVDEGTGSIQDTVVY